MLKQQTALPHRFLKRLLNIRNSLLVFCLFSFNTTAWSQIELSISVGSEGTDIPVTAYQGDDNEAPLFLWLPSHRGTSSKQRITANTLAELGYSVWIADLHLAYFVDEGRKSVDQFPDEDIAELIEQAATQSGKDVIVIAGGRASKNALGGARARQLKLAAKAETMALKGIVLFSPTITIPAATPGETASYQPIAQSSNVPIYIIQPGISTNQWRANEVAEVLRSGGSSVFVHRLPGVHGGFHLRPDEDLQEADFDARSDLPFTLGRAAKILSKSPQPTQAAPLVTAEAPKATKNRYGIKALTPYTAALDLPLLEGQQDNIQNYRGNVVLVSFWASWCEPCIRELPSLKRLYDDYKDKGLKVVTVNAGEDADTIKATVDQLDMSAYTLMMDKDGTALKDWNVYGFPTNFLVDQNGQVVFGSFGAVEWDEPEPRAAVESLL